MAVKLWAARLERPLTERETALMLTLLPPARRERLERLRLEEKRREPLCAYLLLLLALRQEYGWHRLPEIAISAQGKPWFPQYPEVHFNISHTAGAVFVGISDEPIGVDIEHIRPVSRRSMERLAKAATEEEFFRSWVRREARAKRSGTGVGTMVRAETPLQYGERYYEIKTFAGYVAGVATRSPTPPETPVLYSLDEIM